MLINCPFYKSAIQWVLRLGMMVLGTMGLIFFNVWVAVVYLIYSTMWWFLAMPVWHCQYCYYKGKETAIDSKTGKTIEKLMPKDKWVESCLKKHVECGKKWGFNFFIIWFLPIVLIGISLFLSFSVFALLSLISFIAMLAVMLGHMRLKVCPTCAIMEECYAAF